METEKHIAVIGATGMIGRPTVAALARAGLTVRAVCRQPDAVRLPASIQVVKGDVSDEASLRRAFQGCDTIYLNLATAPGEKRGGFHPETDGLRSVLNVAGSLGIRRVAYLSSLMARRGGSDWWALQLKREAIQILKASDIDHLIFYPSNFIENLAYRNKRGRRINLAGRFPHRNFWIAADDYGALVAQALKGWRAGSRDIIVQGPEPLTYVEAAEAFARAYRKDQLTVSKAPLALLKLIGRLSPTVDYIARISEVIGLQDEPFESDATWAEFGRPPTTIAAYAAAL